ncbi:MAG TPA: alpha/beta hydrolase [Longimicrobiales bacterium]|nr:alpha/beta hydrolase [Longimicrobiales bacterium]
MLPSRRILFVAVLGAVAALCLWQLRRDEAGIVRESFRVGDTPATLYRAEGAGPAPLVLVAHGFSGSRRLMEPLALALAGRGYVAVTYDFMGHGRHPHPMRRGQQAPGGAPSLLEAQTGDVADAALGHPGVDGGLALAGHSMATNILVRYAQRDDRAAATVGVSMFAPAVDSVSPPNLLAVMGALEGRLEREARRVVAMVAGVTPAEVDPFTTYGSRDDGTARRMAVAPWVGHIGVLYSGTTLDETVAWMDGAFGRNGSDPQPHRAHRRGLWILLLMTCVFLLARPLATGLPRVSDTPAGADAPWRRVLVAAGVPALLTPVLLRPLPTSFLPVVVGDYLALHFLTFGVLSGTLLWWTGGRPSLGRVLEAAGFRGAGSGPAPAGVGLRRRSAVRILVGSGMMVAFFLLLVAWPLDRFFTSFFPVAERLPLLLAVLAGTLPYFLADEWLTRGAGARRGAYAFTKLLFLLSLVLAVALDFRGLFFLVLIVPLVLAFFAVHGLFSRWAYRATGSPLVAALGNAVAFAWALSVTFPLYAGR